MQQSNVDERTTMPPEVRVLLVRARQGLTAGVAPTNLDVQTLDLVNHLLRLLDMQRLTAPFLKIALETLTEASRVASGTEVLGRFAVHQCKALERRRPASQPLPWVAWGHPSATFETDEFDWSDSHSTTFRR